jgi:hypothetical protein
MHLRIHDRRILAIDLRPRRFGYSVFEGPRFLLDWGANAYPSNGDPEGTVAARRLAALLRFSNPSAVVVKMERWESAKNDSVVRSMVEAITRETSSRSIPICLVGQNELASTFRDLQCETKYEIASVLTRIFPELLWKLPPPRRIWESEHPRMTIFDAIALGFTYWQRSAVEFPPYSENDNTGRGYV